MKENFKILLFIEIITVLITVIWHVIHLVFGEPFLLIMYPVMIIVVGVLILLNIFIIAPLANWFFK